MRVLVKDAPRENLTESQWDYQTILKYQLTTEDVERLESGKSLWRGDTCFTLETRMEVEEDDIL